MIQVVRLLLCWRFEFQATEQPANQVGRWRVENWLAAMRHTPTRPVVAMLMIWWLPCNA